jgi:hypothetical protein
LAGITTRRSFAPKLGAVRVECNREDVASELSDAKNQIIGAGKVPMLILNLPAGTYRLVSTYHADRRESRVIVEAGGTNIVRLDFVYGAATLESQPSGATVVGTDGHEWGTTPLTLPELKPGAWAFTLRLNKYLPVEVSMEVKANETNTIRTNLVNASYANAIERARRDLATTNLQASLFAVNEALRAQPGDADAVALSAQVTRTMQIQQAEAQLLKAQTLANNGETAAAMAVLEEVRKILPENIEAKKLQADLLKREQANAAETRRQEASAQRERRPRDYFAQRMQTTLNNSLFDQQEVRLKGSLSDIEGKLVRELTNQAPKFKLLAKEDPNPETFFLQAMLSLKSEGWRRCDLVGGQTGDGEVTLVFKVFEYAYVEAFSLRAAIGANNEKDMVPVHASRLDPEKAHVALRRAGGINQIRARIRAATGD